MKPFIAGAFLTFFLVGCIPLSFAPNIKTDKVKIAKRFKRNLPKQYAFIFEDPKEADEFFDYLNTKYQLPGIDRKIPIWISMKPYIMNFYERKRTDSSLNLIPIFADGVISAKTDQTFFDAFYTIKDEKWYVVITITDLNGKDGLAPKYPKRDTVVSFLRALKKEYLNTANYMEAYFRR